jgi:hypothetical protein
VTGFKMNDESKYWITSRDIEGSHKTFELSGERRALRFYSLRNNHEVPVLITKSHNFSIVYHRQLLHRLQFPIPVVLPLLGESEKLHSAVVRTPRRCLSESVGSNLPMSLQKFTWLDICVHSRQIRNLTRRNVSEWFWGALRKPFLAFDFVSVANARICPIKIIFWLLWSSLLHKLSLNQKILTGLKYNLKDCMITIELLWVGINSDDKSSRSKLRR